MKSFGSFRLDTANHCLWRDAERVSMTPKAYDVLCHLVEYSGRLVTPDEMLEAVWTDTYVNPEVLRKYILEIRKALGDKPDAPQFVETVPKRGYRFIAPVCACSELAVADVAEAIPSLTTEVTTPESAIDDRHFAPPPSSDPTSLTRSGKFWRVGALLATVVPAKVTSRGMRWMVTIPVAIVIGLFAVTSHFYLQATPKLTDKDTIVVGDFDNKTGDAVFDDTLKTALTVSLNQSPFLNVVSDNKAVATLKLMTRPPDTKLTPDVARELCQRAGSKTYLAGSIASLGSQYVLGLKAVDCHSGDTLAQEQTTAAAKEKVLDALGRAASKLRGELGESLTTVQKLDVPLPDATTSSLEALKAYSLGLKVEHEQGYVAARHYYQRAIELDPNFAEGYLAVGVNYNNMGETGRASEYFTNAFQLREHASEWEKLSIAALYYLHVTGELDKTAQTYQEWIASYPRDSTPHNNLANVYSAQGQYEKAVEEYREGLRLTPDRRILHENLATSLLALQRFDDARQTIQQAQTRKLDDYKLHSALYALAFIRGDSSAMADQQQWFAGKPEENFGLSLASDTEAYAGHLHKASELTKRSVDSAIRADSKENGAVWLENSALREAAFGNPRDAKQEAEQGLKLYPASQSVRVGATLAFAMANDATRTESLAQDLNKRFPLDTQMRSLWLPAIHAQLALNRNNAAEGISDLQAAASSIELGSVSFGNGCLYSVYVRAEAFLLAGQGKEAAAEFQKILDHSGIVWNCWTGALAHLGVARANALQLKSSQGADAEAARVRALAAYKDFLALWKDADPDIPILKQAQAEYAKLQ
jgi:DNA-binding winged helix-turn-helix (wHTH) protein/tetratricopeptide (TPR) repeat protein